MTNHNTSTILYTHGNEQKQANSVEEASPTNGPLADGNANQNHHAVE